MFYFSVTIIETVLESEDEHLQIGCSNERTELDKEVIERMERQLREKELIKTLKAEKLINCMQSIITHDNPCLREYLNKSCKKTAKSKFTDPKGLSNLSEVSKFFLNVDINEFRGRVSCKAKNVDEKQGCVTNFRSRIKV